MSTQPQELAQAPDPVVVASSGDIDPNGDVVDLAERRVDDERRERLHVAIGETDVRGGQLDAVLRLLAAGRALDAAALGGRL